MGSHPTSTARAVWHAQVKSNPKLLHPLLGVVALARKTDLEIISEPQTLSQSELLVTFKDQVDRLSLFSLDPEAHELVFLTTTPEEDLWTASFVYQAQRRSATAMLCIPYEMAHQLMDSLLADTEVDLGGATVVHLHSTGRCGSTLLQKTLGCIDSVQSLSEPDAFSCLELELTPTDVYPASDFAGGAVRQDQLNPDILALCRTVTLLQTYLCLKKFPGKRVVVYKYRSLVLRMAPYLQRAVPGCKSIFLYRALPTFTESWISVFNQGKRWVFKALSTIRLDVLVTRKLRAALEEVFRDTMMMAYDARLKDFPGSKGFLWFCCVLWISHMEMALHYVEGAAAQGGEHAVLFDALLTYEVLNAKKEEAVYLLLDQMGLQYPKEGAQAEALKGALSKVFSQDSQAGTVLSSAHRAEDGFGQPWFAQSELDYIKAFMEHNKQLGSKVTSGQIILPGTILTSPIAE